MTETYAPTVTCDLREDTEVAFAEVEKHVKSVLKDFKKESKRMASLAREVEPMDGELYALAAQSRAVAGAGIRAGVAAMVGLLASGEGKTTEERLATIAQQAVNVVDGNSLTVLKADRNSPNYKKLEGWFQGFDQFSDYQYQIELAEWEKYLNLTTARNG